MIWKFSVRLYPKESRCGLVGLHRASLKQLDHVKGPYIRLGILPPPHCRSILQETGYGGKPYPKKTSMVGGSGACCSCFRRALKRSAMWRIACLFSTSSRLGPGTCSDWNLRRFRCCKEMCIHLSILFEDGRLAQGCLLQSTLKEPAGFWSQQFPC